MGAILGRQWLSRNKICAILLTFPIHFVDVHPRSFLFGPEVRGRSEFREKQQARVEAKLCCLPHNREASLEGNEACHE